jgi:hypothetical protein
MTWSAESIERHQCNEVFTLSAAGGHPTDQSFGACGAAPRTFHDLSHEFSSLSRGAAGDGVSDSEHGPAPTTRVPARSGCGGDGAHLVRDWKLAGGRSSALDGHTATLSDGHIAQDAARLARRRARRAAAARALKSAGSAAAAPKYISSGVCPRNAECGSTRLCAST